MHICKLAARTILRCGVSALVMLCLGLYFIFPACKSFLQLQSEKHTPFEIIASTDKSYIDLNTILQIDGIQNASPIMQANVELTYEDYSLQCQMSAVYSNYLNLYLMEGAIFPDSSNMPYLVLNKAAAESFVNDGSETTVSIEDTVLLKSEGSERKAIVCGIFDDNSDSPVVYMSYTVASKSFAQGGTTKVALSLANKSYADRVISNLQKYGLYATVDSSTGLAWNLMEQQVWQTAAISIALITCSIILIRGKRSAELKDKKGERAGLLMAGLTANEVREIYPLRLAMADILCIVVASIFLSISGSFTILGICIALCFSCIHFAGGTYGERI